MASDATSALQACEEAVRRAHLDIETYRRIVDVLVARITTLEDGLQRDEATARAVAQAGRLRALLEAWDRGSDRALRDAAAHIRAQVLRDHGA